MELEGMGWENVEWFRVPEKRILLGLVDKTVVKILNNVS